jgi:hypothetical protein
MLNEMFVKLSILQDPNMKMCTLVSYSSPLNFSRVLGKTEDKLVLSCKGSFNAGQFYTAISRMKDLDGLFLLDEVTPAKIKVNIKSLEEICRMVSESPFVKLFLTFASLGLVLL